ncbi:MAG: response regulator, partial [Planctomycetia bacterium]
PHPVRGSQADAVLEAIDFLAAIGHAADAMAAESPWAARAERLVGRLAAVGETARQSPTPAEAETSVAAIALTETPLKQTPAPAATSDPGRASKPARAAGGTRAPGVSSEQPIRGATAVVPSHDPDSTNSGERVVRVTADSLSRLLGLVGEALVEARQFEPVAVGLAGLRSAQARLCQSLAAVERRVAQGEPATPADLSSIRQEANRLLESLSQRADQITGFAHRNEHLSGRLHREVMESRMRPLADGIRGLPRLVRDLARSLGKQARLEIRGERTGVDRDILDQLEAPLAHLVRNAVDHGLETPDRRQALGKEPVGTITLEAGHRAGMLVITITDDGGGIDRDRLRHEVVARGLAGESVTDRLSDAELLEFLFLPGFSTRRQVTEISGRGVGLDAVRTMVKGVGGIVRVQAARGGRTGFTLQVPITMSVVRAVLVDVAGEPYAFPLTRIERILSVRPEEVRSLEGRQYVDDDGRAVGLVLAAEVLDLDPAAAAPPTPLPVIVIGDDDRRFGLIVDGLLGERDLEVRPLDRRFGRVADVAAASVLENGDPVLIVDVDDLARSIDALVAGRRPTRVEFARRAERIVRRKRILVVDDSLTVRELERQLLQSRGYAVDVAVDGVEGWNAFRDGRYDLVISDVDMPRMDGIDLVTRIKADPAHRDLPVVIVSYKDREEDRLRGLEAGANRYLTKASFHDETFLHTIVDLIGEPTG